MATFPHLLLNVPTTAHGYVFSPSQQSVIALLDSTLGDAVINGGGDGEGDNASSKRGGDLSAFGGIVFPSDEFQFWSG